jgi:glycosyltransferase involved in cell wall biosynthesis
MATYNCARFLDEAVESLLGQTFGDFELVIIDDASTDDTPAMLRRFQAADARVRWERNEKNRRLGPSLNRGLRLCRAPLVARADADDVFYPPRLERQVSFMDAHPEIGVVSAVEEIMDERGRFLRYKPALTEDDEIRFFHMFTHAMSHTVVMYRRELVMRVGGYDESFATGPEDYDLYARLFHVTRFGNLPEALVRYRVRAGSDEQAPFPWRQRMKNQVAARQLSAYLGREVCEAEAGALWDLYHGYSRLSSARGRLALGLAEELRYQAGGEGRQRVVSRFNQEFSVALSRQAVFQTYSDRKLSGQLFRFALKLNPVMAFSPQMMRQLLRFSAPRLIRSLRRGSIRN